MTVSTPAGQSFAVTLRKNPSASIVPADATTAAITFTGTYETKLSVIDSRVEVNPATSTGILTLRPGGTYTMSSGVKYPVSVIRNSKVVINGHATANRVFRLMGQITGSTATLDATASDVTVAGQYSNVKNLTASGIIAASTGVTMYNGIQATDCNDFAVSPAIFPGLAAAQTANTPFIFQGCNVPNGRFYHHAQIANTYKNIDFAKAQADLGKIIGSGYSLVSSEVEGMYRLSNGTILTALVESHESVKGIKSSIQGAYGTTIYKDAYLSGFFDIAGTNVFGNKVRSHPLAQVLNVQPRAVQGTFNEVASGGVITGVVANANRVVIPGRFRLNRSGSISINGVPLGVETQILAVDPNDKIVGVSSWAAGDRAIAPYSIHPYAFIQFRKTRDAAITPADLAGVTVTTYNGCKIVNTGETAVNMKGNIRVEDNATLVNAGGVGSAYFGGNSVVYYNPTVWEALDFRGTMYMKDNAVFAPTSLKGSCTLVHMEGNAKFIGSVATASTNLSFTMRDNAVIEGRTNTHSGVVMSGNSKVTATGHITAASRGVLVMRENASIEADTTAIGAITLAGNYKGNVVKTWTGKRTITDVNEPEYDNNVKTQYDF